MKRKRLLRVAVSVANYTQIQKSAFRYYWIIKLSIQKHPITINRRADAIVRIPTSDVSRTMVQLDYQYQQQRKSSYF